MHDMNAYKDTYTHNISTKTHERKDRKYSEATNTVPIDRRDNGLRSYYARVCSHTHHTDTNTHTRTHTHTCTGCASISCTHTYIYT